MKNHFILISFLFFTACGFTPIYKDFSAENLNIQINSLSGDKTINDTINKKINIISDENSDKFYVLNIDTNLNKIPISKNKKGKTTIFKLTASSKVNIKFKSKNKIVSINQSSNLEISDDNFDTDTYEKTIKENFGTAIANEIILVINSMK
ncbi:hypothetical protein [Candidatus Pelagibacter sp. HIMB1509]|uniref:hypothetical protein n=1 Tax=Candidatus Pelagibacter sp. HIMB1509 TaxID=3413339 RepID=UPI003F82DC88